MKILAIVLSVLMVWAINGEGVQRNTSFFGSHLIEVKVRKAGEFVGKLGRKVEEQPLDDEENRKSTRTVPDAVPITRSRSNGVVKPGNRCGCPTINASDVIKAVDFNVSSSANLIDTGCGFPVIRLIDEQWLGYLNVDFGEGAKVITTRIANGSPEGSQQMYMASFYLDKIDGFPFASFYVLTMGDWCKFIELKTFVADIPKGVHDLYIVSDCDFRPEYALFNLDWFRFSADYPD